MQQHAELVSLQIKNLKEISTKMSTKITRIFYHIRNIE